MPTPHLSLVSKVYQGHTVTYREDGWFNATEAAAKFGKKPHDWLRLPDTDSYIGALCRQLRSEKISLLKVIRGGRSRPDGTWLHPKLAVPFARWLDDDFAVWCDMQIDGLIRGSNDWSRQRHMTAASYKVMTLATKEAREQAGKSCATHHYSNEARLVNWALAGKFCALDRDAMTLADLDLLGHLEIRNALLIVRGLEYERRKLDLNQQALRWKAANQPSLEKAA
ncbi:MAG: KilA-N domain-containing protein [Hydrogenophaga sp.]|uniref:KilA-N domain-containing protein n=1 Tax=Hydrogenophaga sp. TaxID=1904254 RepID=UPI002732C75F|nr:KilA-N domain-containing protein [Hydrogenophaga sp.]MDP3348220.1 KilA-N domain-containing protein [Hydrogenophaga sp.]